MKDVSIILPSIRPNNLEKFYAHAKNACKKYSFEIVIASPYSIPDSLMKKEEIKYLHLCKPDDLIPDGSPSLRFGIHLQHHG
jgi:hypothetical protein